MAEEAMPDPFNPEEGGAPEGGTTNESQTKSTGTKKRKPLPQRSEVWDHFTPFVEDDVDKARCNYCAKVYMGNTKKNGTSSLRNHLNSCKKLPLSGQTKQTQLSLQSMGENENILTKWQFDQKACRTKLAAMIIIDELPFKFVENEGFRDFMLTTQPNFKIPSRFTVSRDCYQLYLSEKKKLSTYFKRSGQRICITTDTWTSLQKINYMCITAHYIDVNWNLHKKIINFCPVESHKGEIMGRDLDKCLREWGVSKVFTVTVDNASSNSTGEAMRELFEEYKVLYQPEINQGSEGTQGTQDPSSNITSSSDCSRKRSKSALGDRFIRHKMESGVVESKCELDIYLKESVFVTKSEEFDILNWWKLNSSRFPILSQLARDVLAIPISTVASESAFSTGGRVLDAFRSSLTPKVVESLLCAQNWLRKSKHHNSVEEDMISIEKIESAFSAISVEETDETATLH